MVGPDRNILIFHDRRRDEIDVIGVIPSVMGIASGFRYLSPRTKCWNRSLASMSTCAVWLRLPTLRLCRSRPRAERRWSAQDRASRDACILRPFNVRLWRHCVERLSHSYGLRCFDRSQTSVSLYEASRIPGLRTWQRISIGTAGFRDPLKPTGSIATTRACGAYVRSRDGLPRQL